MSGKPPFGYPTTLNANEMECIVIILNGLFGTLGVISFFTFGIFGLVSFREQELRAAKIAWAVGLGSLILFIVIALSPVGVQMLMMLILFGLLLGGVFWIGFHHQTPLVENDTPTNRVDERDIMFSRKALIEGTDDYENYYRMRPENEEIDAKIRLLPGVLSEDAKEGDTILFESANASFMLTEALQKSVEGPDGEQSRNWNPESLSGYLKDFSYFLGAHSVGITDLKEPHVYSHSGRGTSPYGQALDIEHTHSIAFTVEMSYEMMGTAPKAPVVMESARQYVEAAAIALQVRILLSRLGYRARAHIDGDYQVIAPLVARDAGLGEIGRMGLLMTPDLGPRVRIGVVTTDAPLIPDVRRDGAAMIDFCTRCKKCADNCPSRSISFDDRQMYDGAFRWKIDPVSCFRYWNVIGTDCGVCMKVCPYSHPDTFFHNILRGVISHSGPGRRIAHKLDDVFYGRYPKVRPAPNWTKHGM
jgi:ferredoxin